MRRRYDKRHRWGPHYYLLRRSPTIGLDSRTPCELKHALERVLLPALDILSVS